MKLADIDIPTLEGGWINLTEAAELLGYTRSYMYKRAGKFGEEGGFNSLRRIGSQASYVVSASEVQAILEEREQEKEKSMDTDPKEEVEVKKPRKKKKADDAPKIVEDATPESPVVDEQPEPAPVADNDEEELDLDDILNSIK